VSLAQATSSNRGGFLACFCPYQCGFPSGSSSNTNAHVKRQHRRGKYPIALRPPAHYTHALHTKPSSMATLEMENASVHHLIQGLRSRHAPTRTRYVCVVMMMRLGLLRHAPPSLPPCVGPLLSVHAPHVHTQSVAIILCLAPFPSFHSASRSRDSVLPPLTPLLPSLPPPPIPTLPPLQRRQGPPRPRRIRFPWPVHRDLCPL